MLATPFPLAWENAIHAHVAAYAHLSAPEVRALRRLVRLFVTEKHWEGCGGFVLDDTTKAIIAAQACMLILELGIDAYAGVETILVYPSAMVPRPSPSTRGTGGRVHDEHAGPIVGQAWGRGPVILAWDAVVSGGLDDQDGHNVVYHELAHKLDMAGGDADGVPPLADADARERWLAVLEREYGRHVARIERGDPTFLDPYAATSPAELFAVATEHFFEQPEGLEKHHAALYALLAEFYRQDPVVRERARTGRPWRARQRIFRAGLPRPASRGDTFRHLRRAARDSLHPFATPKAILWIVFIVATTVLAGWLGQSSRGSVIPWSEPTVAPRR